MSPTHRCVCAQWVLTSSKPRMGNASLQFLAFALAVVVVFNLGVRSVIWRQSVLLVSSLVFLGFFSTTLLAWLPLVCFLLFGFTSVKLLQGGHGRIAFVPLLLGGIAAFVWLKKYTFIP